MTTTRAGIVLRHIRGLADASARGGDRQLLERFTARRDESAFAALVRRHGPMVLGVCRRVLHDAHDAEDAFQATFLVLASRAGSIGKAESLGGWLYRVAYNTALKARSRAAARRRREQAAGERSCPDPLSEVTGRELVGVLDEELQRLPEGYRLPLVLCYLEGLTGDEAARRLGYSPSTLKRRLDKGRERLRGRLERRGLALSAALLAATGGAAVPPSLAAATVGAALLVASGKRPVVSASVASLLAQRAGPWKAAALLTTVLIATTAGALASRAPADARGAPPPGAVEPPKAPAPPAAAKGAALTGRVVDAGGKPVASAEVAVIAAVRLRETVLARGRAGADGRFRLTLAGAAATCREVCAVAGKDGHGLALEELPAVPAEIVLRLPPEKVVRGRVIDLQGLPAAGVEVRVPSVPAWKDFAAWPKPATTDRDGKFVLRGLSADYSGCVHVEGADFAPQLVEIMPGAGDGAREMNVTLLPAHVLEGIVTGEDTGEPIPGAFVKVQPGGEGESADTGRYRIKLRLPDNSYKPSPGSHRVWVTAPDDQPYLPLMGEAVIAWPKGAVRHEANFALKRGVLVRGKVTDASSGNPVGGALIHDAARLWTRHVMSGEDGTFRIALAPGRGHLLVKGPNNDYIATQITSGELEGGKPSGPRSYPDALVPLDLKAAAREPDVAVKLHRGVSVRGRLLGPDGRPAAEAVLLCWSQLSPDVASWMHLGGEPVAVRGGAFELRGCDPDETYPVHFLDPKNQLGATALVSPKEIGDGRLAVRLQPCGRAVVRFVDGEGKPVRGFRPEVRVIVRPGQKDVDADADDAARLDPRHYAGGARPVTGADGRATFPALIPGATYRLVGPDQKTVREVTVKAGVTLELPDVVIEH